METENKIICANCGHLEVTSEPVKDIVYFPDRLVYVNENLKPYECPECGRYTNVILFGRNYIGDAFNFKITQLPHVIESNKIWQAEQDRLKELKKGKTVRR